MIVLPVKSGKFIYQYFVTKLPFAALRITISKLNSNDSRDDKYKPLESSEWAPFLNSKLSGFKWLHEPLNPPHTSFILFDGIMKSLFDIIDVITKSIKDKPDDQDMIEFGKIFNIWVPHYLIQHYLFDMWKTYKFLPDDVHSRYRYFLNKNFKTYVTLL